MKTYLFFILMKGLMLGSFAQAQTLTKGTRLPNHSFIIHINDSTFRADLTDYQNKFILIDFWSKECLDCIASMPKLLDLQEKFKDKLTILLVTTNTEDQIKAFFSKFKAKEKTNKWIAAARQLPIVSDDTFFSKIFPYIVLPTHVWIKDSLVFYGMAYPTSTSEENIKKWIARKNFPLDEIVIREINPQDPITLLKAVREKPGEARLYSMLLNRIEFGMGASSWVTDIRDSISNKNVGITCINSSITELYKIAYRNSLNIGYSIPDYRIIWRTTRRIELTPPPLYPPGLEKSTFYDWAEKNTFCYTLKLDPSLKQDLYIVMQSDLDRWFGLKSSISKMKVKCRVLKFNPSAKSETYLLKHNPSEAEKYIETDNELIIENLPVGQLYLGIQKIADKQKWSIPLINEISFKDNINIRLSSNSGILKISLNDLKAQLKKFGLTIVEEYRIIDILLIKDFK